ncbi:serine hydrolase [Sphingomonas silueang]|uniref:serine hydrolase n=1 Tax=Sphingomonas silueang TaxID=3156617 RepID=UPI0032B517E8
MLILVALQAAASVPVPPAAVTEAVRTDPAFRARAEEAARFLGGEGTYDTLFAPDFRARVPKAQIDAINAQLATSLGKPTGVESIAPTGPWSARVRFGFERGTLNADLTVDPAAPHAITGLLLKGAQPRGAAAASIDAVVAQLAALPGATGFAFARLGDGAPVTAQAHEAARPLAIGSAFKLVILAELARSIAAGERRWSDTVTLDGAPLPGGAYTRQPKGTRVSYRELAERMISVSDNSATDILLFDLGRDKVEAMLPVVGMTDGGGRNRPFLGTLEAFKLKGVDGAALGREYAALDPAGRRRMLAGKVAATPVSAIVRDLFQDKKPVAIEQIEWFASPNDLIRTFDWLRRHSDGPGGADLRAVLSKNPGLPGPAAAWRYVGYKGGSEPGVLSMNFLLQGKDGGWYALSATWNDTARDVDQLRFMGLVETALTLAAPK